MKTAVVTAMALAAATLTFAPTACAEEPTRILIVGDSVTHGLRGDYTWRYFAWQGLMDSRASVDFVGPHSGTNGVEPDQFFTGPYADADFDRDHAARWGMSMQEMLETPDEMSPAIGDLVAASDPDVIVEQLGVNDFDREGLTADEMAAQVRRFVADARAVNPDVDVVLGSLPQTWIREVGAFNAALPGLAGDLSTEASRVVSTPVAAFTNGVDTYDFAHPTTAGQRKIAVAMSIGLEKLGIGEAITEPVAPALVEPTSTPVPPATSTPAATPAATTRLDAPRKVRAERSSKRTVVTWKKAAGSEVTVVRCGRRTARSEGRKAVLRSKSAKCSVRAASQSTVSPWSVVKVKRQR